jgi:membrane protein required for colicin V production
MSTTDLLLLIPIVMGAFNGYKRGLLVEIIGILAFIFAIVFGFRFLGLGMGFVAEFIGEDFTGRMLPYMSFLLIFFPTIFFINKIGWLFRKALRLTFLGVLDGLGGAALGAVLWAFGLSVLFWLASAIGFGIPERFLAESEVYPFLENFAPNLIDKISGYLPSLGEVFQKFTELGEKYKE